MRFIVFLSALLFIPLPAAAGPPHWDTRAYIAYLQSFLVGQNRVGLWGDSIQEAFWWNTLGSTFVLNGGQGGAGVDQTIIMAAGLAPVSKPHVSIVLVGINDCQNPTPTTDFTDWGTRYAQLLTLLKANSTRVVAVSVFPIEPGKSLSSQFSEACRSGLNGQIVAKSAQLGVTLLNANYIYGDPATGYSTMLPGNSIDGVHLSASGMTKQYNAYLSIVQQVW